MPINPETSEFLLLRPKIAKLKSAEFGIPIRPLKEKIWGGL